MEFSFPVRGGTEAGNAEEDVNYCLTTASRASHTSSDKRYSS